MAEKFCHIFTYKLDAFFIEKKILESVQQMLEAADERHRPSAPQKLSVSVKESYLLLSASAKTTIAQLAMACPFVPGRSIGTNFKCFRSPSSTAGPNPTPKLKLTMSSIPIPVDCE